MDTLSNGLHKPFGLYSCHEKGGNQIFGLTKSEEIVTTEEHCVGYRNDTLISVPCSQKLESHLWTYNAEVCVNDVFRPISKKWLLNLRVCVLLWQEQWILQKDKNLCMRSKGSEVIVADCNPTDTQMKWELKSNYVKEQTNGISKISTEWSSSIHEMQKVWLKLNEIEYGGLPVIFMWFKTRTTNALFNWIQYL